MEQHIFLALISIYLLKNCYCAHLEGIPKPDCPENTAVDVGEHNVSLITIRRGAGRVLIEFHTLSSEAPITIYNSELSTIKDGYQVIEDTLVINRTTFHHAGYYTIRINSSPRCSFYLDVLDAPDGRFFANDTCALLSCSVLYAGPMAPKLRWMDLDECPATTPEHHRYPVTTHCQLEPTPMSLSSSQYVCEVYFHNSSLPDLDDGLSSAHVPNYIRSFTASRDYNPNAITTGPPIYTSATTRRKLTTKTPNSNPERYCSLKAELSEDILSMKKMLIFVCVVVVSHLILHLILYADCTARLCRRFFNRQSAQEDPVTAASTSGDELEGLQDAAVNVGDEAAGGVTRRRPLCRVN